MRAGLPAHLSLTCWCLSASMGICAHSSHFWHKPVHETGQPAHLSSACCSLTAGSSTHSDKGQEVATPATSLPLVRVLVPPLPELPCTHNSHPQQRPKAQRGRLTSHPAACPWLHKSPLPPTRPTASSESPLVHALIPVRWRGAPAPLRAACRGRAELPALTPAAPVPLLRAAGPPPPVPVIGAEAVPATPESAMLSVGFQAQELQGGLASWRLGLAWLTPDRGCAA